MIVEGIGEQHIPARKAPDDFPTGLPVIPPTLDETYQLLELWDNVRGMARLSWKEWDGEERCEYMVWMTEGGNQYRIIWDEEDAEFSVHTRQG